METDTEDIVADQYEKWVCPEPIKDLAEYRAKGSTDATCVRMVHLIGNAPRKYTNVYEP